MKKIEEYGLSDNETTTTTPEPLKSVDFWIIGRPAHVKRWSRSVEAEPVKDRDGGDPETRWSHGLSFTSARGAAQPMLFMMFPAGE